MCRPQVALFTATMPPELAAAASKWLLPGAAKVAVAASAADQISRTITQARCRCQAFDLSMCLRCFAPVAIQLLSFCRRGLYVYMQWYAYALILCIVDGMPISSTRYSTSQVVHVCAEHKKPAKLLKHLSSIRAASTGLRNPPRVLVFANRIKTVRFLYETIQKEEFRTAMLHGERSQAERSDALRDFKSGKAQV